MRRKVENAAAELGVIARCRLPRRDTDVAMVFFRGRREDVLRLPLGLLDVLTGSDVEIIRSSGQSDEGDRYLLVVAVTHPIGEQQTQLPERRAKLRRRLQREKLPEV